MPKEEYCPENTEVQNKHGDFEPEDLEYTEAEVMNNAVEMYSEEEKTTFVMPQRGPC